MNVVYEVLDASETAWHDFLRGAVFGGASLLRRAILWTTTAELDMLSASSKSTSSVFREPHAVNLNSAYCQLVSLLCYIDNRYVAASNQTPPPATV